LTTFTVREHNTIRAEIVTAEMASSYAIVFQNRPRIVQIERESLERRPGGLHELPLRGFCVRRDVRRDDLQSLERT
jgi:hypothetical protein